MWKLNRSISLTIAALSTALLLGAAAPSLSPATPVVNGAGKWLIPDGSTIGFQVQLVVLPDGTLNGHGFSSRQSDVDGNAWFKFDVIDSMPSDDDPNVLGVLGVITETKNAPFPVGSRMALLIQDNGQGSGTPDKALSAANLPPFVTLALLLAGAPPTAAWFPLAGGNFVVH